MFTLEYQNILTCLRTLGYDLLPVRIPADGRLVLIIKGTKEAILTARLNQQFKLYLVPDVTVQCGSLGIISTFFDDHNEPITLTTPLFNGDEFLLDLADLLGQDTFDLYFFDEHDHKLMGVRVRNENAARFRAEMRAASFPMLDMTEVPKILDALTDWFGRRDANGTALISPASGSNGEMPDKNTKPLAMVTG